LPRGPSPSSNDQAQVRPPDRACQPDGDGVVHRRQVAFCFIVDSTRDRSILSSEQALRAARATAGLARNMSPALHDMWVAQRALHAR